MSIISEIASVIDESENILISSHVNPDGDNLGSSLAMLISLERLGKNVRFLWQDKTPKIYSFLPGIEKMIKADEIDTSNSYLFIALDSADLDRLGPNKEVALSANKIINIDHHVSNPAYGDYNFVNSKASATGELVYQVLKEMEIEIDEQIATCIYTAISSDTGGFKYSNTTSETHKIISNLYETGLDVNEININLYQNNSIEKLRLYSKVIDNMETHINNKVAISIVTREFLEETGALMEDSEDMVETIRDIAGVEVSILLKEYDGYLRVSTRSKRYVDVSEICSLFGGGGHKRAAGCTIYLEDIDIEQVKSILIKEVGSRI